MNVIKITTEQRKKIQELEFKILCEVDRVCNNHHINYSVAYGTMLGAIRHKGFIPWDDDVDIILMRKDYIRFKEACRNELGENFFYQSNDTDLEYFYLYDKIRLNNTVFRESHAAKYNMHQGVYIDVFPVDFIPANRWKRAWQYYSFHFFRTGVQTKYLQLSAREGSKKIAAAILRLLYAPFSLPWLYKKAHQVAMAYDDDAEPRLAGNFFSPYKKKDVYSISIFKEWSRCVFEGREVGILSEYDRMLRQLYGDYMQLPPEKDRITRHALADLSI